MAFLHIYSRRLWNFSIRGASRRLRGRDRRASRGSQPTASRRVIRTCRGAPGRRCDTAPLRHDGAAGPTIFSDVTTPSPTAAAILANSCACTIRSCVAHAVDSADTVSTPSFSDLGVAWAAICSPTTTGHRPNTDPSATRPDQPRLRARSRVTDPSSCGSRESGAGPRPAAAAGARHPATAGRAAATADVLALDPRRAARLLERAPHQVHACQTGQVGGRPGFVSSSSSVIASTHARSGPRCDPLAIVSGGHGCTIETRPLSSSRIAISILPRIPVAGNVVVHGGGHQYLFRSRRRRWPAPAGARCRVRRTRRPAAAPDLRRRPAVARMPRAAATTPSTTIPHGWQSLSQPDRPSRNSRSSRCGPTRHTPRSSSASRRRASASSSAASNSSALPLPAAASFSITSTPLRYWIEAGRDDGASSWYAFSTSGASWLTSSTRAAISWAPCAARCPSHTSSVSSTLRSPRWPGSASGLQQCGALPQHLVVVRAHRTDARPSRGGQLVEVAAAFTRIAADQRQVLGCEQHGTQHPEHFARRRVRGSGSTAPCWPSPP